MKKAHLIGICGKGMSALAILMKQKGWKITGSDQGFYDPVASLLKNNGIRFKGKHSAKNIPKDASIIIIGKHAKLVPEENEEVRAAFSSGIPIKSMPEMLSELSKGYENTVVAGSFGKSTVSALLAWCLLKSNKDPSYFIGAVPLGMKMNAGWGKSKQFIFEGDEYPSSNWDSNSKFLHLHPKNLLLISAEHDHINIFHTEKDYLKPYKKLISALPSNGILIYNKNGKNVSKLVAMARCKKVDYGMNKGCKWHPENIRYGIKTSFDLFKKNKKITSVETEMLGKHNIENIVGAGAFLLEKKLLNPKQFKKAINSFKGLSGRLDLKTKKSLIPIYEGYGSSYEKAKSVFSAINLHFPKKKIIAVFEPHTFSWRNKSAKKWYKNVFNGVDKIIVLPPPKHGKKTHEQMSFLDITKEIQKNNNNVYPAKNEKEALTILKKYIKVDNIIILMSSGSLFGLTVSIPKLMEKMFPKN